jgi:glycolate dehydrogenase iron-sulfur subunit
MRELLIFGGKSELAGVLGEQEERLLSCVHCGFCLPVCPTYRRLGDENDSPRGRLYLMRAVVEGRLEPASDAFQTHIDRCLGCLACEPVCPSGVEYGTLLQRAREVAVEARPLRGPTRWILRTFERPAWLKRAMATGRLLRDTGLATLIERLTPRGGRTAGYRFGLSMLVSSRTTRWASAVSSPPALAPSAQAGSPVGDPEPEEAQLEIQIPVAEPDTATLQELLEIDLPNGPSVALLVGCVQEGLFQRVNEATHRVLEANGCEVVTIEGQGCCGALHAHGGATASARTLARANVEAYETEKLDAIVVNSAGCGAAMKEYGAWFADDVDFAARASSLSARVKDVMEFLDELDLRVGAPLAMRFTYDAPCHLHHAQRVDDAPLRVLSSIPGLEHVPLTDADECCGGAGIYGVTHPSLGGRIGSDKVSRIIETKAAAVLTPNPGCMMQIGASLRWQGAETPVLHPIEVLDESYRRAGFYSG